MDVTNLSFSSMEQPIGVKKGIFSTHGPVAKNVWNEKREVTLGEPEVVD